MLPACTLRTIVRRGAFLEWSEVQVRECSDAAAYRPGRGRSYCLRWRLQQTLSSYAGRLLLNFQRFVLDLLTSS